MLFSGVIANLVLPERRNSGRPEGTGGPLPENFGNICSQNQCRNGVPARSGRMTPLMLLQFVLSTESQYHMVVWIKKKVKIIYIGGIPRQIGPFEKF